MPSPKFRLPLALIILLLALAGIWFGFNQSAKTVGNSLSVKENTVPSVLPSSQSQANVEVKRPAARSPLESVTLAPPASVLGVRPEWKGKVFVAGNAADVKPAVDGIPARAWLEASESGKSVMLDPNQNGEFPRIAIMPNETVRIAIAYENQPADLPVAVAVADDGTADGSRFGNSFKLDAAGMLSFDFKATAQLGMYRLFLTTASGDRKMLHFWAGTESIPLAAE